jgi:restriction system protein
VFGLVAVECAAGGVLITSGRFTIEAEASARGKPLDLIDGPRLLALIRLVQNGQSAVPTTASTPEKADDAAVPPICPACGRRMVLRISKRGSNAGHRFWGCSGYPGCRGTVSV